MKILNTHAYLTAGAFAVLWSVGCGGGSGTTSDTGNGLHADATSRDGSRDTAASCDPSGPCTVPIDCNSEFWSSESLPSHPWWLDTSISACMNTVQHGSATAPAALDDCGPAPTNFLPYDCHVPVGGAVCNGHYWTQICHVSADCSDGMGCINPWDGSIHDTDPLSFGYCEQRCGGAGDPMCLRCGFVCAPEGYCKPEGPPPGHPCVADCQCLEGEACNVTLGQCVEADYLPDGICGIPDGVVGSATQCQCNNGTCEVDARTGRGCCYASDGTIAKTSTAKVCE